MTIQWYPGHMAKAKRELNQKLQLIDVTIEVVDARLPQSSHNPMLNELVRNKPRLMVLNKSDLADPVITKKWLHYYHDQGIKAVEVNAQTGKGINQIVPACESLVQSMKKRLKEKGLRPRAVRALILGIPNVGKSSLINRLSNRSATRTGDRPGVTKGQQWVKSGGNFELLDTPGILWPKFDDPAVGLKLAASGAIRDEVLPTEEVALYALQFLIDKYPEQLQDRYQLDTIKIKPLSLLEEIGRRRGCIKGGGEIDYERTSQIILRELRSGKLGPVSFETPDDLLDQG